MAGKFASVGYSGDLADVKMRHLQDAYDRKRYVERHNPFSMKSVVAGGVSGYAVRLPLTAEDAGDEAFAQAVLYKTLDTLASLGVEVVFPPRGTKISRRQKVTLTDGSALLPFFLPKYAKRLMKRAGGDARRCRVAVFGFEHWRTECVGLEHWRTECVGLEHWRMDCVVDCLSEEMNFLELIAPGDMQEQKLGALDALLDEIYDDTGLYIPVHTSLEEFLPNVDVIVDFSGVFDKYKGFVKRGAFIIGMCRDRLPDWTVRYNGERMPLAVFEMLLFLKSPEYRRYLAGTGFSRELAAGVRRVIAGMDVSVVTLNEF